MAPYCLISKFSSLNGNIRGKGSNVFNLFCIISYSTLSPRLPSWFLSLGTRGSIALNSPDDFILPTKLENMVSRSSCVKPSSLPTTSKTSSDSDAETVSKILKKKFTSTEAVILALSSCHVEVSEELVHKMLRKFNNDWISAFGFFKWVQNKVQHKLNRDSFDMMVDILGKCKHFLLMWNLIEEMLQLGELVSLTTMNKVIRRLAGAGRWDEAIKVFNDFDFFGIKKDTCSMNAFLDSLCKEHGVEHAEKAFSELRKQIPPDSISFNILIHGWCFARKIEEARRTMEDMRAKGFAPCVISYTSLIESYCFEKKFPEVEILLDEMEIRGCRPNIVTYTIVMHAFGKAKETRKAFEVFRTMRRARCEPDTSFCNSLIYILGKEGRLCEASRVYEEMLRNGLSPNSTTYNTMIAAFCDRSQEENALNLLRKMEENSCKPDIKTYSPFLKLFCKRKWRKMLFFILEDMFRKDVSIELGTYTLIVRGLCKSGEVQLACSFFEEMVLRGFLPQKSTCKSLLEGLERKKMEIARQNVHRLISKARCRAGRV